MRSLTDNLENRTGHRGLYCVWVWADETEGMPLVARWIDPQAEIGEPPVNGDSRREEETRETWLRINLQSI
jgi:hypothetical protein